MGWVVVLSDKHPKDCSNQGDSYEPIHSEDSIILSARAG